ncbi:MAG: lytic transglycosylase domain-containing protein [Devosia sp.]|uniref:lytic transglycosylase domain-containing protein n=1 Tax=Devosia sp. TaxID=1871048 RepID=UPI0032672610
MVAGVAVAAMALSGCSMASLATIVRPGAPHHSTASIAAPKPAIRAATAVAAATAPTAESAVLAFAEPSTTAAPMDQLILKYSTAYNVPERLIRRIIVRESNYNAAARNGPYWGLMQIRHDTARGMGYTGNASGLLEAETNLHYAVKYLAGAYVTAGGNEDQALRYYASGYYYDAKRKGLLEEAGLR